MWGAAASFQHAPEAHHRGQRSLFRGAPLAGPYPHRGLPVRGRLGQQILRGNRGTLRAQVSLTTPNINCNNYYRCKAD